MSVQKLTRENLGRTVIFSIFFLGILASCSKNPAELQKKFMAEGQHYLSEGKTSEAIIEFQNLLKVNPHSPDGHYWLGKAYQKNGWILESVQQFKEATQENPLLLKAHIELAKYGVNSSQWAAIKSEIDAILKIDPNNAEGWTFSGQRASGIGEEKEAQKDLDHALSLSPGLVRALVAMGDLKRHEKHLSQSKDFYQKALAKDPVNSRAWTGLGYIAQALGQTDEASKDFSKAVEVAPTDLRSKIVLTNFDAQQGKIKEAISILSAIPGKSGDLRIPIKIAEYEIMAGESDKAVQILRPFIRQKIQIPDIDFALAKAYEQIGQKQKAIDMVDKLMSLGNLPPMMKLASIRILLREGDLDESKKFLDSMEGTPHLTYLFWLTKAQLEIGRKHPGEAIQTVTESLKKYPDNQQLLLTLADAQAFKKNDRAAIATLDKLLERDPKNPAFISRKGPLLGRSQGINAEIGYYKETASKYPDVPATEVLYILSLASNKKLPEARQEALTYMEKHPDNRNVQFLLAQFDLQSGHKNQAIQTLKTILEKDPKNVQALVELAAQDLHDRQFAEAESLYRQALLIAPNDANINAGLGETLLGENQKEAALLSFKKSLSENPAQTIALVEVSKAEILSGQSKRALTKLAPLLKAPLPDQQKAEIDWLWGVASEGNNDFSNAQTSFKEAVRLSPQNPDYHASLGELWELTSQWDKAIKEFDKSLAIHSDNPPIRLQRDWAKVETVKNPETAQVKKVVDEASAYFEKHPDDIASGMIVANGDLLIKKPEEAITAFSKILEKHPDNTGAILGKSGILLSQGHTKQTRKLVEELLSTHPDNLQGNLILASIDQKENNPQGVIDHLQKVHQRYPRWIQPAMTLAATDLAQKHYGEAKEIAFSIYENNPKLTAAQFIEANAEMGLGEYRDALRNFKSLAKKSKKPGPLYNMASMAAAKTGNQEEEKKYLDLAISITPNDPIILNNSAFYLAEHNEQLPQALKEARKATSLVDKPFTQDTLGYVLYQMGRYSDAEPYFKKAFDAHFRDPEFLFHYGMNEWKMGQREMAQDHLKKAILSGKLLPSEQSLAQKALRDLSGGA